MHLEILVEDCSGKKLLEVLLPKIARDTHSWRIISYRGLGGVPKAMSDPRDASKRIMLNNLPKLLRGYGRTFSAPGYSDYSCAVIVVCDLDKKCLDTFRQELDDILLECNPAPITCFCFAIEEMEAWLLGDIPAIKKAYPKAKQHVLDRYYNDSICDTWERLADSIYPGGASILKRQGWQVIGAEKYKWAENISPHMNICTNRSPSFRYFKFSIEKLLDTPG
ncbi:MAG: DUF4276 family protein [Dehalogenimonas sp.]|uniref:DUF4276 family protein n=1 Tax=Candidatus Dehalogenimonas loeffleri TaxID=3127115 RepID=A0ABZ2J440_9CHLR|nr:DUF4276 family protein [Dehalogenimonas sp.]